MQFKDGIFDEIARVFLEFKRHSKFSTIKHDYELVVVAVSKYLNSVEDYESSFITLNETFDALDNFGLYKNPVQDKRVSKIDLAQNEVQIGSISRINDENLSIIPTSTDYISKPDLGIGSEDKYDNKSTISKPKTQKTSRHIPKHEISNKDVLSNFNFVIPSQPSANSVEEGISAYLQSLSISQNSLNNYKYGMARYLRCCFENKWDPNASFDEAVQVIINYFTSRSKGPVSLKTLFSEKGTIKKYYEMMGRGDNNPISNKRVNKMCSDLKKESSGVSKEAEEDDPLPESKSPREIPIMRNSSIFSFFDPLCIPSLPTAISLEDGLNKYLQSFGLSFNTIRSYKQMISRYLNYLKQFKLDPNAPYEIVVQNVQAYFKFRANQDSKSMYNIEYAVKEKSGIRRYYEMMKREGSENPILDERVLASIKKDLEMCKSPKNEVIDLTLDDGPMELDAADESLKMNNSIASNDSINDIIALFFDESDAHNSPQLDDDTNEEIPILLHDVEEQVELLRDSEIAKDGELIQLEIELERKIKEDEKWERILNLVESGDYIGLIPIIEAKSSD